jgi:hypothetical protein
LVNDVVVTPGGSLTIIGVVPTNGTAVIVGGTNVLFTPSTNFTGTATIGYTIIDNVGWDEQLGDNGERDEPAACGEP